MNDNKGVPKKPFIISLFNELSSNEMSKISSIQMTKPTAAQNKLSRYIAYHNYLSTVIETIAYDIR